MHLRAALAGNARPTAAGLSRPQGKRGNCHGQGEAPRTRAAGVDEENPAALLDCRLVRVSGNDGGEARGGRVEIELARL